MSSDRTRDEIWEIQLAYCEARGIAPPTDMDAETEAILREILGDESVEQIKVACREPAVRGQEIP
jgi:hypothetical protein